MNLRPRIAWAAGPRDPSTTKLYDRRGYNTQKATSKLEAAIADLKRRQRFGLVFEEHIPETMALLGLPIQVGGIVQRRDDPIGTSLYRVVAKAGRRMMTVELLSGGKPFSIPAEDLLVVKRFGDPIYPTLTSVGVLRRGATEKPHYAVIDGENFHTLQLLVYLFEGQVDCIYIDPPYNTGARDWKYNNRYVDKNDSWRHSKWLSMMEKRPRLAKRLCLLKDARMHWGNHLECRRSRRFS